ncbi:MAG: galactose oxidase early set domain-containing protein, partial [Gammaproteobacteria bacterium]|nr:galactose oxidase early set domain-containing protein [Gammaproteobacteria bacterium]
NGKLFSSTPLPVDFEAQAGSDDGPHFSTAYDVNTGDYTTPRAASADGVHGGWDYPSVLLPLLPVDGNYNARAMFWNGTNLRWIDIDAATPSWTNTGPRDPAVASRTRRYCNMVSLPTGQICVVGGMHNADPEDPVNQVELYTPDIDWATNQYGTGNGTWSLEADSSINNRNYHSTALLLPNGKVWVAGSSIGANSGNPASVGILKIELYEPPYIAVANRIVIQSAPTVLAYGQEFDVQLDRAASNVGRAAIMRNSSVTHSTDNDQRYVGLEIISTSGNTIRLRVPPNGNVAPPGYYMLWLVDTDGNPCQVAKFVRLAHLSCRVIADRSTFSEEEVQALGGGSNASFAKAIYVDFDGFLDSELSGTPDFVASWSDGSGDVDQNEVTLQYAGRFTEASPPHPDVPTRITFAFNVIFGNMNAFSSWIDRRDFDVRFELGSHSCETRIKLSKSPNPYMIDIDPTVNNPHWLSTDVRVFKVRPGQDIYGDTFPSSPSANAPYDYIRGLIDRLNNGTQNYSALPTEGINATLDGAYMSGTPAAATFNFAVARVRYRATTTTAQDVRCFIRMCNYSTTSLSFNSSTVYRRTPGPNPVPLLGIAGNELVSIPFTNERRVNSVVGQTGATGLDNQTLNSTYDIQNIVPSSSGAEVTVYFGVYLDINTPVDRFPLNPSDDGPYPATDSLPIRDLLRSWHTCMVAEIYLDVDPTEPNATPSSSDNLSQRNLAITGLENPGRSASRTAMHSFGVAPSQSRKGEIFINPTLSAIDIPSAARQKRYYYPDELFFDWHNLPTDTEVTLYFSDIDTKDLQALLSSRISSPAFTILDSNTIKFTVGDYAWLPLPGA